MLCFRVTTLFAVSNDRSLSSQQTPLCRNKVPDNGRIPVMLTVPHRIQHTARRGWSPYLSVVSHRPTTLWKKVYCDRIPFYAFAL